MMSRNDELLSNIACSQILEALDRDELIQDYMRGNYVPNKETLNATRRADKVDNNKTYAQSLDYFDPVEKAEQIPFVETQGSNETRHLPEQQHPLHCMKCMSHNVQWSWENTQALLGNAASSRVDIVCVQEPFWGIVKHVALFKLKNGDEYLGMVIHN